MASALTACGSGPEPISTSSATAKPLDWDAHIAELARSLNIENPPDVSPIRTVSPAESQAAVDACLADDGWIENAEGWVVVPEGQDEASNLSIYICTAQYPIDPVFLEPLTQEQFGLLYDHWTNQMLPCVEAHGVVVDWGAIPSRETFLAAPYAWTPFPDLTPQVVQLVAGGEVESVDQFFLEVCPGPDERELRGLDPD